MTNEDKIKVLAELDGWKPLPEGRFHPDNPIGQTPPQYLTSYDAIIPLIQKQSVLDKANTIVNAVADFPRDKFVIDATPEQLADALIKAVGKWKDQ